MDNELQMIVETIGGIMTKKKKSSRSKRSTSSRNSLSDSALRAIAGPGSRKRKSTKRRKRRVSATRGLSKSNIMSRAKAVAATTAGLVVAQRVKEMLLGSGMTATTADAILIVSVLIPDIAKLTGNTKAILDDLTLGMAVEGAKSLLRDNGLVTGVSGTYQNWINAAIPGYNSAQLPNYNGRSF